VQDQGHDDVVERTVGEGKRLAEVGDQQRGVLAQSPFGQLDHRGAGVEAGHDGPSLAKRRGQGT
jgi:hypothetical protein